MHIIIAKVTENLFDGEAVSMTVPGAAGEMTILGEHEPLITTLKQGAIIVRSQEEEKVFQIESGVLEVSRDGATVVL